MCKVATLFFPLRVSRIRHFSAPQTQLPLTAFCRRSRPSASGQPPLSRSRPGIHHIMAPEKPWAASPSARGKGFSGRGRSRDILWQEIGGAHFLFHPPHTHPSCIRENMIYAITGRHSFFFHPQRHRTRVALLSTRPPGVGSRHVSCLVTPRRDRSYKILKYMYL